MSIKKLEDGRYEVDIRPNGRNGKRIRRKFNKKHEAAAFEKYVTVNYHDKEWLSKPSDKRKLSELQELWWNLHGKHMDHGRCYYNKINRVIKHIGDVAVCQLDKFKLTIYRSGRLEAGMKASAINRELECLAGMFTKLAESGLYIGENPVHCITMLKRANTEMSYLSNDEIKRLLDRLDGDNKRIVLLCISTGARWGEAAKLKREHIVHNRVNFLHTKTGKMRTVPISSEVASFILTKDSGLLFSKASYREIREILLAVKPNLPRGQRVHVLRHTFATHFMINGGNIVTLQRILGHASITQTMAYAHFAPDYLKDAIAYNPLKGNISL